MQKINKKALMFEPILLLFVILTLSAAFYNLLISEGETAKLGKTSSSIIILDKESKLQLELIEQASLYHIYNSLVNLAENSGFSEQQIKKEKCRLWDDFKINEKCRLNKEKIKETLKISLQNSFNEYSKSQNLGFYTVNIKEENNKLIFSFNSPNINFKKENVDFTINHKFTKEVEYNLNVYSELYNKASSKTFPNCEEAKKEIKIEGLTCKEETLILLFTLQQDKFYLGEKQKSLEYPVQPVIKFSLSRVLVQS